MSTDIIQRLRWMAPDSIGNQAADEIERKDTEIEHLKGLLRSAFPELICDCYNCTKLRGRIRSALKGAKA